MAIVLDINVLCNRMIDIDLIVSILEKYNTNIKNMYSIDNWMWENKKEIEDLKQILILVEGQHIVIIELHKPSIKAMGLYIEKLGNQYFYTLWINTEGYPMLDCEKITLENRGIYRNIVYELLELSKLKENSFVMAGIGLETDFCYEKDIQDIIRKSKNMIIWMLSKYKGMSLQLNEFEGEMIENMYVLYRR